MIITIIESKGRSFVSGLISSLSYMEKGFHLKAVIATGTNVRILLSTRYLIYFYCKYLLPRLTERYSEVLGLLK